MKTVKMLVLFAVVCISGAVFASELVYKPINASFGGSPLNGNWMISQAQAQNTFTENRELDALRRRDPLERFKDDLTRRVLSRLTSELTSDIFGEGTIQEGRFEFGNLLVDIQPGEDGLTIVVFDSDTGNETTIVIPYY